MHKKRKKAPWVILLSIVLAMFVGSWTGTQTEIFGVNLYNLFDILGKIFINALTLIVVPLVSSSIITGIARIGNDGSFGRLGAKTFTFYFGTSLLAILTGLLFVNLLNPGAAVSRDIFVAPSIDPSLLQHQ